MRSHATMFAAAAAAFLLLDAAWLTLMGPSLYRPAIGHLMRPDVDWLAAALFYAVYIAGLVGFAIAPSASAGAAALRGASFGLVAYATYDLTNQATMRGWPWTVTGIDLCWGMFASAAACAAAAAVAKKRG
jgi:uncharacterized membrane protein